MIAFLLIVFFVVACQASSFPYSRQDFGLDCSAVTKSVFQPTGVCNYVEQQFGQDYYSTLSCQADGSNVSITEMNSCNNSTCEHCSSEQQYLITKCESRSDALSGVYSCASDATPPPGSVTMAKYNNDDCSGDWVSLEVYPDSVCFPSTELAKAQCNGKEVIFYSCTGETSCDFCVTTTFPANTCSFGTIYACA